MGGGGGKFLINFPLCRLLFALSQNQSQLKYKGDNTLIHNFILFYTILVDFRPFPALTGLKENGGEVGKKPGWGYLYRTEAFFIHKFGARTKYFPFLSRLPQFVL
jgi:hypothetical protein